MGSEEFAGLGALFFSFTFGEERIAEPVPVGVSGVLFKDGLVLKQVGFSVGESTGVETHVGPGVIAEEEAGVVPVFEHGGGGGLALDGYTIDEAVDGRHVRGFHRGDEFVADLDTGFAWRQSAVGGEVIPGEGDLLGGG